MTTTLEKGGCSLRTQRVTTKQTEHRSEPKRANSQKKTALPLQISDTSGIISDTSGIFSSKLTKGEKSKTPTNGVQKT